MKEPDHVSGSFVISSIRLFIVSLKCLLISHSQRVMTLHPN